MKLERKLINFQQNNKMTLKKEIEEILNSKCAENESNTPDFILAEYLINCLNAFDKATNKRDKYYNITHTKDNIEL